MRILLKILLATLAVSVAARVIPGVHVDSLTTSIIVAVVLGVVNAFVRPILVFFTLPATIVTMGLFLLVVNAVMVILTAALVPGFFVGGFWPALLFSVTVTLIGWFLEGLAGEGK